MKRFVASLLTASAVAAPALAVPSAARAISLDDRIAAQTAIEQVYWNHRIWPETNTSPKPPLSAVLSEAAIRARVENYLAESNALDQLWHRPITAEALQAELRRIVKNSRDPGVLREIFAALGDDPALIAETLARPVLADRLARSWYAHDDRFQGDLKGRAEAAIASCRNVGCMKSMGGRYVEVTWKRGAAARDERVVGVDDREWARLVERYASRTRARLGPLEDTADAFAVDAVVSETADRLTVATVVWDKTPFDAWWETQARPLGSTFEAPAGSYSLDAPSDGPCTVDTWDETPYGLEPRAVYTAVWTGTEMIVWGGLLYNSGGRYNPATDTWQHTSRGANVPSGRSHHSAVWTGAEMIVWGGDTTDALYTDRTSDTGGRYNPASDTWLPTSRVNAPVSRSTHTAVWTGSEMIVWGGVDAAQTCLSSGGRYDPASDSWVPLPQTRAPSPRNRHTAVWAGNQMIVWGGSNNFAQQLDTGAVYLPFNNSWFTLSQSGAPSGRAGHTAVWTGTEMIVWGGVSAVYEQTGGRYSPTTGEWTPTSIGANVPQFREAHTAVWTGTEMIIWGGRNGSASPLDTGARYDPVADGWVTLPVGPGGRLNHSAVWTGSEMIVWGGQDFYRTLNSGGRYAPSTNSWVATAIDAHGEPSERRGQTTVWTGTEMIVWGGFDDNSVPLGTGGRYRPSTDVWLPVSTSGSAPTGRARHTAVWTGTEMIIWGGLVASGPNTAAVNTGGRYDPATDTWTATQRGAHVPTARAGHVAAWTGTEMLVWGGRDDNVLGTGGRFDPATGRWLAISNGNAPAARDGATAVWTGLEFFVWGGDGASGFLNSGGRYAPAGNSWQAISVANAPSARSGHTAVWTGSRMIVWGGKELAGSAAQSVNTGGRYDPASDSWSATSIAGDVPTPRKEHSAVWTGTEMIVWGGGIDGPDNSGVRYTGTGSRYNPSNDAWLATSTGNNAPLARGLQSAVWTGTQMIVWGGALEQGGGFWVLIDSGGRYCADSCAVPATLYRDADGDGYGIAGVTQVTCVHPPGWAALAGDCNDGDPSIHPGAVEACNLIDDDCDGVIDGFDTDGDGIRAACDDCPLDFDPEQRDFDHDGQGDLCDLDDGVIYLVRTDNVHVRWQPEAGPDHWNVYEGDLAVLKATGVYTQAPGSNPLANRRCGLNTTVADEVVTVPPGAVKFSLVTGVTGGVEGSLGTDSHGMERANTNPCP